MNKKVVLAGIGLVVLLCMLAVVVRACHAADPGDFDIETPMKTSDVNLYTMSPENVDVPRIESVFREARAIKNAIELPRIQILKQVRDISFNASYSPEFIENNTTLYRVVAHYFSSETFADTQFKDFADPLFIMAIANVEHGGLTSPKVLLTPALPTRKGVPATRENILNFGYTDYLKYEDIMDADRKAYRGPFQMMVTNMVTPILPDEIRGSEYLQLLAAEDSAVARKEKAKLEYVEGSGVGSLVDGNFVSNSKGKYGDRFNFADCVNRFAGYIKHQWQVSDVNSFVDNKYTFMAITAIGHNSTPGIYFMKDDQNLAAKYYWWPYSSFGAVRDYCKVLGSESTCSTLKTMAEESIAASRKGGTLKFVLSRSEAFKLAEQLYPNNDWKTSIWNHQEKIAYPVQVLYNYFVLDAIYQGK